MNTLLPKFIGTLFLKTYPDLPRKTGIPDSVAQGWIAYIAVSGPKSVIPRGGYLHRELDVTDDTYRTRDGLACFDFRFHLRHPRYEVEIVSVPANGIRHRFSDMEGTLIFSGNNPGIVKYAQAKQLAAMWAEYMWPYICKEAGFAYDSRDDDSGETAAERYYKSDRYGEKVIRLNRHAQ